MDSMHSRNKKEVDMNTRWSSALNFQKERQDHSGKLFSKLLFINHSRTISHLVLIDFKITHNFTS